jgi:dipeptidyl aminopeptidase/acylaminoacyl peptidase
MRKEPAKILMFVCLFFQFFTMKQLINCLFLSAALLVAISTTAQSVYQKPPANVVKMVEAPPTPFVSVSPEKDALMLVDYNPNPGIATLARPILKLAGLRIDAGLNSRQRITEFSGVKVRWFDSGKEVTIARPLKGRLSGMPQWSPNGRHIAFGVDTEQGVELWTADTRTGKATRLGKFYMNDILGGAFGWMDDSERLFVKQIPANRGPKPAITTVPTGPNVDETLGKKSQVMTYQDLLKSESDERQFAFLGTSQMALINIMTGKSQMIGKPGLFTGYSWSPDEQYLLVTELKKPFSYRVQYSDFARSTEVWDRNGQKVYTVASSGVTDETPRQGVVKGPREAGWQALYPAKLYWAEALDGGDPKQKTEFRDKIVVLSAPFTAAPKELMQLHYRYSGVEWTTQKDLGMVSEYDRDRRWVDVWKVDLNNASKPDTMFSLSANDDYNNPGDAVQQRLPNGEYVLAQEGDWLFFQTEGASPEGSFPRLDKINIKTREKVTVFKSKPNSFESFVAFAGKGYSKIITNHQTKTEPPNFFEQMIDGSGRKALTEFKDPAPEMTNISKRLVKYNRKDGIPLSGTLYLPASYQPDQRLPLFMWAYPLEYSDASTAGQVRGSDNRFTFYRGDSPLFFVTQGYAVLMDATVPVVGDPETMNNTFVEQITAGGRAAIDYLDSLGIIDRKRVGVGGHSYGAFMTANLLAHSDDYAYGIARSGAYNRTLTPFGFQSERRSYWEAKDIYQNLSPFTYADKIKKPLLMIHGEADNNPGTFTIQSERLYQAIKGNGGTARLVLLPYESHGYRAQESVEHVLYEMFDWARRFGN